MTLEIVHYRKHVIVRRRFDRNDRAVLAIVPAPTKAAGNRIMATVTEAISAALDRHDPPRATAATGFLFDDNEMANLTI